MGMMAYMEQPQLSAKPKQGWVSGALQLSIDDCDSIYRYKSQKSHISNTKIHSKF